jgi:predicted nucleic acid-binding protein
VFVFDATALEALFHGYRPLSAILRRADQGLTRLGFPVLSVVEAGTALGASVAAWEMFQWIETIKFLPLEEVAAIEISSWPGTPGARHALWEARSVGCPIITCDAALYAQGQVTIVQV